MNIDASFIMALTGLIVALGTFANSVRDSKATIRKNEYEQREKSRSSEFQELRGIVDELRQENARLSARLKETEMKLDLSERENLDLQERLIKAENTIAMLKKRRQSRDGENPLPPE